MEIDTIKVAKARKYLSVRRHFPRSRTALHVLVVHHGSNISTCSPRISFTRLVIILWFLGKKFLLSCFVNTFYLILCTLICAIILSINIQVVLNNVRRPFEDDLQFFGIYVGQLQIICKFSVNALLLETSLQSNEKLFNFVFEILAENLKNIQTNSEA